MKPFDAHRTLWYSGLHFLEVAMRLREFLRNNNIKDLEKIGVYARQHPKYPNLWQFTYDQIESDKHKSNPLVIESRGVILDRDNDWVAVARPFDRFYNFGESCAATVDWMTSAVEEKVDGSLCIVYYYGGKWNVATKGSPDASGNVGINDFTFADLFWTVATKQGVYDFLNDRANTLNTYLFELTSPYNKVVVYYPESKLTLLGVRCAATGKEFGVANWEDEPRVNVVKSYSFSSMEEMVAFAKNINGAEGEGFVVCDGNYNRVKVKSENYLALAHLKEGFGPRRVLEIIRNAETEEFQKYVDSFPEMKPLFDEVKTKYNELVLTLEADYAKIANIPSQKDFAFEALKTKVSGAMFEVRKHGVSFQKYLAEMNIKSLANVLGLKDIEIKIE